MTFSNFCTFCIKTGRFQRSHEGEIQTTIAGGLWGAYLMTIAHFCKDLASSELAKLRAIKSVKLSSNLSSKILKCVTVSHFTRFV